MYEEGGDHREGGTCSGRKMGRQAGRQEWDVRWGEKVREGWRRRPL